MTADSLARECRSFAWALVGDVPTDRVVEAYRRAHERAPLDAAPVGIDAALVRVAAGHPWLARLADAYASFFVRRGVFRTKLVALLAMLESGAPHHWRFETSASSPAGAWLRIVWWGLGAGLKLLAGIAIFAPVHVVTSVTGRNRPRAVGS